MGSCQPHHYGCSDTLVNRSSSKMNMARMTPVCQGHSSTQHKLLSPMESFPGVLLSGQYLDRLFSKADDSSRELLKQSSVSAPLEARLYGALMEPKSAVDERKQHERGEEGGCKDLQWDLNLHCAYGGIVLA